VFLVGPDGLLSSITKTVLQAALDAELTEHLGYEKGDRSAVGVSNERNGSSSKTVHTDVGPIRLDVPRDREGSFEPQIVPKHSRRIEGFNEAVISLYAKGLTTGEIRKRVAEIGAVHKGAAPTNWFLLIAHRSPPYAACPPGES
jgi:putative transposase